jgi:hypothetical protein
VLVKSITMTQSQLAVRATVSLVVLTATFLLLTYFVQKLGVVGGWHLGALLTAAIFLSLIGVWFADFLMAMRRVRYVCSGCKRLSSKIVKRKVRHGYYHPFYECEACGHSEEAKD